MSAYPNDTLAHFFSDTLAERDPDILGSIRHELSRQQDQIELIASENIVSRAVMEAQGSIMTNKYAEGYPGRRYYGGCEYVDVAEALAIERAKKLFDCEFVNVQPHSGAQANGAVMMALLQPGDTIMGLSLASGGHLTHGAPPAQSGKWFNAVQYGLRDDDHTVNFDEVEALANEHKPKLIIAGGSAYPRTLNFAKFREIADKVGALSSAILMRKNCPMEKPRLVHLEHDAVLALSQILGIMLDQLFEGEGAYGWSSEKILDLESRLMAPGEDEGVLLGIDDAALLLQGMAFTEVMSQEFSWIDTVRWVTDFVTEELRKHWSEEEWRSVT